ncbi:MAG: ABC transporter ATP-binding protein, partial [Pseudomonadota bacterium]
YQHGLLAGRIQAFNTPLMMFMFGLATGLIILFGGYEVVIGKMTIGQLSQFASYLAMMIWPITLLGMIVAMLARGIATGGRIFDVLDTESAVVEKSGAVEMAQVEGRVVMQAVTFSYHDMDAYDMSSPDLGPLAFSCEPGETIALVGSTGSGKSTFVNLLPRFYDVTGGSITIDGIDVRDVTLASLRRNVGVVQQDVFLFSATIRDNIAYGAIDAGPEDIEAAAKAAYLHDFVMSLPNGYDTWIGERGVTLSGGQKQRLAIARMLLADARILIFDDSTSSVDTETEYHIREALSRLTQDRTSFVIAHRLKTVQAADQILVMQDGQIVERGTHDTLMAEGTLYPELVASQLTDEETPQSDNVTKPLAADSNTISVQNDEKPAETTQESTSMPGLSKEGDLVDEITDTNVYDHSVAWRLMEYLQRHRALFIFTVISLLIAISTTLVGPYLIGYAIDHPISNGNLWGWSLAEPSLMLVFLLFIGNALFMWAIQYVHFLSLIYLGQKVIYDVRTQMFRHLQKLSLDFFDRHQIGRLMSRVQNDVVALQEVLAGVVTTVISDILTMLGIIVILFLLNPYLAMITLSIVPVLVLALYIWQRYVRHVFTRVPQAMAVVNQSLEENISGAKAVQSLSREDVNLQAFEKVNRTNLEANLSAAKYSAGLEPITAAMTGVASGLVIIFGGFLVLEGKLMPGELIAFSIYIGRFFDPIYRLSGMYAQLQRAMASGQRIFELMDVKPTLKESEQAKTMPPIRGDIRFEDVHYAYVKDADVLRDINLKIHAGETIALVGSTGAGKTTLVNLVGRFYDVTAGRLSIDGIDIREVDQASLRRQIGVVLQTPFLFSGTVRENILYGKLDATEQEMIVAAQTVNADAFIQKLPAGYDTVLQEGGGNLSLGQRQLISFARALLADPRILILDEATANIDTQTETLVQHALNTLKQGRTSLIIAHRLSTIRDADRIVVLERGKIIEMGTHNELIEQAGAYWQLYSMN